MKKHYNGKVVEMTQAEIDEMKANMPEIPVPRKTEFEERVEKLEQRLSVVTAFFEKMGWGAK